jgi:CHAT domain-containing protein
MVQDNLAFAYLIRIRGQKSENIERAIEAATNSLAVRSREFPSGEKPVQTGMSDIGSSGAILVTLKPDGWERSQSNLGKAYRKRINGDPADNVERAIASHEAALTLWTRDTYPVEWAGAQTDLGEALTQRRLGSRAENLDRAITAFHAALEVYTSQAFPRDNLSTARLLGQALIAKGDWRHALEAFDVARTSFRLLFGQGLNEAEARDVLQEAGPLFTESAYAMAELGDGRGALARLEEGKARLLGVALKLEGLNLSATQRRRVDELRVRIREGEAAYEAARGEEKAAKIAAIGRLRAELLSLVDAADATSGRETERDVIALATAVLPKGSALVAPNVADNGGKLILVIRNEVGANLSVIPLPSLTNRRLGEVLGARDQGGWLGAYNINYLDRPEQVRRHREWLGGIEKVGAELGALVEEPLIRALAANGLPPGSGAPITILPVGALGLLPLGLAQNPETRRYLIEDYTVTLAPSLQALASARARASAVSGKPTLAAIVNPTKDLPFTAVEGALVESRFTPDRRLAVAETAATRQAVLAALKGRDYWHFSSHGYFDWDEPRASGLLLSNRKPLTVGDLLDARDLGAPRLAVLSACETGLYDIATTPNEFIGLPAAFLQLGAGGVLATLWPVSDLSTGLLMAKFYDFHQGEGLGPASALRKAQNWLRTATSEDVENYLRAAAASGRLSKELAASLDMTKRTVPLGQGATGTARAAAHVGQSPVSVKRDMPFAHPYYWGGFTLTGL